MSSTIDSVHEKEEEEEAVAENDIVVGTKISDVDDVVVAAVDTMTTTTTTTTTITNTNNSVELTATNPSEVTRPTGTAIDEAVDPSAVISTFTTTSNTTQSAADNINIDMDNANAEDLKISEIISAPESLNDVQLSSTVDGTIPCDKSTKLISSSGVEHNVPTSTVVSSETIPIVDPSSSATAPTLDQSVASIDTQPRLPGNWHILQPLPSLTPSSSSLSTTFDQPCVNQPLVYAFHPIDQHIPSIASSPPYSVPMDRITRCPPLHRYAITVPYPEQHTIMNATFCIDVIDENTVKNMMKKRHSATGNGASHTNKSTSHSTNTTPNSMIERVPNTIAVQNCTMLYTQHIEHSIQQQQYLYYMTWFAIMEECQWTWYRNTISTSATTTTNGNNANETQLSLKTTTNNTSKENGTRQPFSYYTDAPTTATTMNVASTISNSSEQLTNDLTLFALSFTPSNLMQRIKQGCLLAYQELQQEERYVQLYSTAAATNAATAALTTKNDVSSLLLPRRSSTRIIINQTSGANSNNNTNDRKADTVSTEISSSSFQLRTKHGGRVATSLLQLPSSKAWTASMSTNERRRDKKSTTNGTVDDLASDDNISNNEGDDENDEEYNVESDLVDEDDEVEVDDDVVKDENDVDGRQLGSENPYLVPDRYAILEWIGKKGSRLWSTNDIQTIFAEKMIYYDHKKLKNKQKGKKKTLSSTNHGNIGINVHEICTFELDPYMICQLLYDQSIDNAYSTFHSLPFMMSSSLSKHDKIVELSNLLFPKEQSHGKNISKIVVQLSGGDIEDINETIDEWDLPYFTRTQFTVRLLINENIQNEILYHVEQQAVQQQEAFRQQRQYEAYRYKSIQGGYCKWGVSWMQAASEFVLTCSSGDAPSSNTSNISSTNPTPLPAEDTDLAYAKVVAAELEGGDTNNVDGVRRRTRRVGESSGVFYGNQSNLSQKQLMDALLRLISSSKQPFQTLVGLLNSLPDDSTDPMKRMRTIVGKLLYKRNQLACLHVQTDMTDSGLWKMLEMKSQKLLLNSADPTTNESQEKEVVNDEERDTKIKELESYLSLLQQTELQLRRLVMKHLTEIPIAIVATAGDDRTGSMESMDDVDFEDPSVPVPWQVHGHPLLSEKIYRPIGKDQEVDESTKCYWFTITAFVPSVEMTLSGSAEPTDKPSIGRAKEPIAVERRIRFQAVPVDASLNFEPQILNESQVRAGLKAAEMQRRKQMATNLSEHPLTSTTKPKISLIPTDIDTNGETDLVVEGFVVGHDRCMKNGSIENRILVLPKVGSHISTAFWTSLILPTSSGGSVGITCTVNGRIYEVQQFDFHQSSKAYHLCMTIVDFLERNPKCTPFLQPVDPIALGIPDYFNVVKDPMDVSTLRKKLENGEYAHISPTFMKGQDAAVRMLNGTFRRDVERIFDNAMLYNPPHDWIHQAASVMKKTVVKKMEQVSASFFTSSEGSRQRKQTSIYVDYDSDVDMYTYESDCDDDNKNSRKRKSRLIHSNMKPSSSGKNNRGPIGEDAATRAVERGIRIQRILNDTHGVRGALANLPIKSNALDFSLPEEWLCRHKQTLNKRNDNDISIKEKSSIENDLDELRGWHRLTDENEQLGIRRSTRAVEQQQDKKTLTTANGLDLEYVCTFPSRRIGDTSNDLETTPSNRFQVEILREQLHELHFAKLFQSFGKLQSQKQYNVNDIGNVEKHESFFAEYAEGTFPPYLGRIVPMVPFFNKTSQQDVLANVQWEIREPFVVPALRWIIRGLLHTDHLVQSTDSGSSSNPLRESLISQNENLLLFPNHVYYIDEKAIPYNILDTKELTRRKKQRNTKANEEGDSDDDIEMSEYEKARAERMARNKERLVALGLA